MLPVAVLRRKFVLNDDMVVCGMPSDATEFMFAAPKGSPNTEPYSTLKGTPKGTP